MGERLAPRYPIYVPSKGRAGIAPSNSTIDHLRKDGVPVRVVIEECDFETYARRWPDVELLVLPFADQGSVVPARNWIKDHATAEGHDRHWQLDDNIKEFRRLYRGKRIPVSSAVALAICEHFTDRYTNIAIAGLNYQMFTPDWTAKPFYLNCHVYSCCLFDNRLPFRWRGRYNEDTDLCLQALAAGYCTVALNVFVADKMRTMNAGGGNTEALSYFHDGRLKMARALERQWPHVVDVKRRFGRPQHVIRGSWHGFDNKLIRRADIDWSALALVDDEHGMVLEKRSEPRSPLVIRAVDAWRDDGGAITDRL